MVYVYISENTVYSFLIYSEHLELILKMAEQEKNGEGVGERKIGRPRVRGIDILRDPLLNKVIFFINYYRKTPRHTTFCLIM